MIAIERFMHSPARGQIMLLSMYSCIYMSHLNVLKYTHPCYVNVFSFQVVVSVTLKHSLTLYNKNFYLYVVLTLFLCCFFSTFFLQIFVYILKSNLFVETAEYILKCTISDIDRSVLCNLQKKKICKIYKLSKIQMFTVRLRGCILKFVTGI